MNNYEQAPRVDLNHSQASDSVKVDVIHQVLTTNESGGNSSQNNMGYSHAMAPMPGAGYN